MEKEENHKKEDKILGIELKKLGKAVNEMSEHEYSDFIQKMDDGQTDLENSKKEIENQSDILKESQRKLKELQEKFSNKN